MVGATPSTAWGTPFSRKWMAPALFTVAASAAYDSAAPVDRIAPRRDQQRYVMRFIGRDPDAHDHLAQKDRLGQLHAHRPEIGPDVERQFEKPGLELGRIQQRRVAAAFGVGRQDLQQLPGTADPMNLNRDAFGRSPPNRVQNMGSETTHGNQSIVNVILQEPWHDAVTTIRV